MDEDRGHAEAAERSFTKQSRRDLRLRASSTSYGHKALSGNRLPGEASITPRTTPPHTHTPGSPSFRSPTEIKGPLYLPPVLTFRASQVLAVALLQGTHRVQGRLGPAHQVVCKYRVQV